MTFAAKIQEFWHRRVVTALLKQLKQGSSPSQLASSLAWGSAIALFPVMGSTTFLCALVGQTLKLNHVALQLTNYLLFPLQLIMVLVFLKAGDFLWGVGPVGYSIPAMMAEFENSPAHFFSLYGVAALRACLVWALVVPGPAFLLRALLRPWLERLALKLSVYTRSHPE